MNNRPIGVFDSGLGGLTAVKELRALLPQEDIIYFGDTGRVPYGNRSRETITRYAKQAASFLLSQNVKLIIAACGTVSSTVTDLTSLTNGAPVPCIGVVKPTCAAAVRATKNRKIGVIGTTTTIRSGSYQRELSHMTDGLEVYSRDCPLFVPLVENGFSSLDDPIPCLTAQRYLTSIRETGVDTLILGCTHYPLLHDIIAQVMGPKVALINSGRETALYAAQWLKENGLLQTNGGSTAFYVSDSTEGFSQLAQIFLGMKVEGSVQRIAIESYGA